MRNISNSEVTTWLTCRRMYHYAFMLNLAPKVTGTPLARGTLGHSYFQRYAEGRLDGMPHDTAVKSAEQVFPEAMAAGTTMDVVLETKYLCERYMKFHQGWSYWEILGTEQKYDLKVTDGISIPIRYDLYVREKSTDRKLLIDFKFAYDFWQPSEHDLNAQFPKYITVMNNAGVQVDGAALEEIRTRKLGAEKASDPRNLWRRTFYYPSVAKKRNTMKQHIAASLEIENYRSLPDKQREDATIPVLNKHGACKYCNFRDLCASELVGGEIAIAIEMGYTENTYGYNKTEINMEEL